jgi:PAS domain-containing protein
LILTIVANIVDGVIVIDERSQIESLRNFALKMFGYEDEAVVIGKDWQMLIFKDSPPIANLLSQSRGSDKADRSFRSKIPLAAKLVLNPIAGKARHLTLLGGSLH